MTRDSCAYVYRKSLAQWYDSYACGACDAQDTTGACYYMTGLTGDRDEDDTVRTCVYGRVMVCCSVTEGFIAHA